MSDPIDLYALLPSVYRLRDAAQGYPLQAFLALVSEQANVLKRDIDALEDDLFIETCSPWVVSYIGDLVANRPLYESTNILPRRADVANTIRYRRGKGTHAMLEGLAADVTGWSACVVELFESLGWTQNANHARPTSQWFDLRQPERCTRIDGAFDAASRTVDVRPPSQTEGLYAVRNLGFFLFRIPQTELLRVPARVSTAHAWGYHFSPLGERAPLFQRERSTPVIAKGTAASALLPPRRRVTELDVASPIRRELFSADLATAAAANPPVVASELYGDFASGASPNASLHVTVDETPIEVSKIVCRRLRPWPSGPPTGDVVAIDVESGRLALGTHFAVGSQVDVDYRRGFPAPIGGGSYPRDVGDERGAKVFEVVEGAVFVVDGDPYGSVDQALSAWAALDPVRDAVISIKDSRTYDVTGPIAVPADKYLVIQAAPGQRPLLVTQAGGLSIGAPAVAPGSSLRLDGIAVEGWLHVDGDLDALHIHHTTLVPGRSLDDDGAPSTTSPSLVIETSRGPTTINTTLDVDLASSISGPIVAPATIAKLTATDTILDGIGGLALADAAGTSGPVTTLQQVTVLGATRAHELSASNCAFGGRIDVDRLQSGCVRFSYVPRVTSGSPPQRVPRRYRCQPELAVSDAIAAATKNDPALTDPAKAQIRAVVEARVVLSLTRTRFGDPAYAQLSLRCAGEITRGADDGSEMGAYFLLHQPQREANLRIRLDEYVPFGLAVGLVYVT